MVKDRIDALESFRKQLEGTDVDLLREMVKIFAEQLMGADADAICGADYGERSTERVNRRNGYRERAWDTRTGTIALQVPKLREGTYFPDWLLEPRRRAERAFVQVVAECYVRGVSTRRVEGLVRQLGIDRISKSRVSEMAKELDEAVEAFRSRHRSHQDLHCLFLQPEYAPPAPDVTARIASPIPAVWSAAGEWRFPPETTVFGNPWAARSVAEHTFCDGRPRVLRTGGDVLRHRSGR